MPVEVIFFELTQWFLPHLQNISLSKLFSRIPINHIDLITCRNALVIKKAPSYILFPGHYELYQMIPEFKCFLFHTYSFVKISAPFSVMITVCSACAAREPSLVR